MPIETPEAIDRARGFRRAARDSGSPCCRAKRSHAAISTAALAMWWPRMRASAAKMSRGCAKVRPSTSGAMKSAMMCHAVRVVSAL